MGYLKDEPEIWVDLKDDKLQGTEKKYSISSYGRVWNKLDECFVAIVYSGRKDINNPYECVNLSIGSASTNNYEKVQSRVHYLMACNFFGPPPEDDAGSIKKQTCDHIDRDRFNNKLWNLRWLDRKGQAANRKERTDTLIYKVKQDYKDGIESSTYKYFTNKLSEGCTYEEVKGLYEQKMCVGGRECIVTFKGIKVNFYYLCKVFNRDVERTYSFYKRCYSLEELFTNLRIKEKDFSDSYEIGSAWFPSKASVGRYHSLNDTDTETLIVQGNVESYLKYKQHKKDTYEYTKELQQEKLHGKDWGDGIFGTIHGIARKYKICDGTLWHRVNKAGMTMKEALEAPVGSIDHHWYLNNKWYHKQILCKSLEVNKAAVTQRMAKGDKLCYALLSLSGIRDVIFNINGNIFSKLDIATKTAIPCKRLKLKRKCTSYKELFTELGIISEEDYFEVISRK